MQEEKNVNSQGDQRTYYKGGIQGKERVLGIKCFTAQMGELCHKEENLKEIEI